MTDAQDGIGIESAIELGDPSEPETIVDRQSAFPAHDHLRHHGISQSVQHRSRDLCAALSQLQHQQRHEPQRARVDDLAGALQRRPRLGDGDPVSRRHDHHSGKVRRRALPANHRAEADHLHHAGADLVRAIAALRALGQLSNYRRCASSASPAAISPANSRAQRASA